MRWLGVVLNDDGFFWVFSCLFGFFFGHFRRFAALWDWSSQAPAGAFAFFRLWLVG